MPQTDMKPNDYDSSSEEEETSGSEEEHSSGSESDEVSYSDSGEKPKHEPPKAITVPPNSASKPQAPDPSESGESGSDTDSDSGSDSDLPIGSKPMERVVRDEEFKLVKKDGSKSISTPPPAKSKRPPPAPTANEKDAKKAKKNTANVEPKKALPEESDSDTDSDPPPKKLSVTDYNVKPIASKPMEREAGRNLESKSAKKPPPSKSTATDDDSKKQLFQRLWSEDDEIAILQGMIDYKNERNGESPSADMGEFYEFIKKSLHVDVSRAQLVDKVRRLKKKYLNNASKEKDGKDRSFSKSHEKKGYELSKLIWGGNSNSSININSNTDKIGTECKKSQSQKSGNSKAKPNGVDMMEVEKKIDVSRFVKYGGMSDSPVLAEEIVKAGMELVDGAKRAELELKWKKLKEEELVLYVKRMELLKEQALVVLEAVNSSGN